MPDYSIVEYYGINRNGQCGYCKQKGKRRNLGTVAGDSEGESAVDGGGGGDDDEPTGNSQSLGVTAHSLSPAAYLQLLDCGWRRSGNYVYKPIMDQTCCPQYTIRLDSHAFYLSRSQRRVLRQMNEFLRTGVRPRSGPVKEEHDVQMPSAASPTKKEETSSVEPERKAENPVSKKKLMRRQRCFDRWLAKGLDVEEMKEKRREKENRRRRTVESYLIPGADDWKHRLEVKLVRTDSDEAKQRYRESFELFCKYQETIHDDKDKTMRSFNSFLIETPLNAADVERNADLLDCPPHGSYHQWYLLDDKLIAVGVVDILPSCLSSKYLYYDPEYSFLSMGTYTALRELSFVKHLSVLRPALRYYYMGYYIHTCPKMRYKAKFRPSELLCDATFKWVPLSQCEPLLSRLSGGFTPFCPNEPPAPRMTLPHLNLLVMRTLVPYRRLSAVIPNYEKLETPGIREKLNTFISYLKPSIAGLVLYLNDLNILAREHRRESVSDSDSD